MTLSDYIRLIREFILIHPEAAEYKIDHIAAIKIITLSRPITQTVGDEVV